MIASWTLNDELASRSRLADYAPSPRASAAAQLVLLIALGVFAAILTSIAASPIRLPGHAILRGTLPLICGLSLAPRRGAGTIMSVAAMVAFAAMSLFGAPRTPFAAVAGLAMLGPLLDLVTFAVRVATGATATATGAGRSRRRPRPATRSRNPLDHDAPQLRPLWRHRRSGLRSDLVPRPSSAFAMEIHKNKGTADERK